MYSHKNLSRWGFVAMTHKHFSQFTPLQLGFITQTDICPVLLESSVLPLTNDFTYRSIFSAFEFFLQAATSGCTEGPSPSGCAWPHLYFKGHSCSHWYQELLTSAFSRAGAGHKPHQTVVILRVLRVHAGVAGPAHCTSRHRTRFYIVFPQWTGP